MKQSMLVFAMAAVLSSSTASAAAQPSAWTGSWAAAPMAAPASDSVIGANGQTYRNIVHLSLGGRAIRLKLSNEYGAIPLNVADVHVALSASAAATQAGSDHTVTFNGAAGVTIPAGSIAISDSIAMPVPAFTDLAVSLFIPAQTGIALTYHAQAISTNYAVAGDEAASPSLNNPTRVENWYALEGVDVDAGPRASSVVVLGASVVNGTHSTADKNRRWPNDLAVRLHANAATAQIGVLNEGIGGNRILHDGTGLGGLARLDRDGLAQTNVKFLIFSMGTNDIGRTSFPTNPDEKGVTAEQMEWAMQQTVWRAHAHGIKIIGATLNPYEGAAYFSPAGEQMRQAVNRFILSSNIFDGTIDFDRVTRDPAHPSRFLPAYDSGDHLHPNDAGYQVMADAIDLTLFRGRYFARANE